MIRRHVYPTASKHMNFSKQEWWEWFQKYYYTEFPKLGLAVELDKYAIENSWLTRFPMWDWVGGGTSELSAVGLLPAALQRFDLDSLLAGARESKELTRTPHVELNPAAQLVLAWNESGNGKGAEIIVVLPYKDRLELFSKCIQQFMMESLGKELNLIMHRVNQGITVLGNNFKTRRNSYIKQLIEELE